MTAFIDVLSPGLFAHVQDQGRIGYREFGVPVSGAVRPDWMALANHLVGNDPSCAGLEFSMMGPTLRVTGKAIKLVVAGEVEIVLTRRTPMGSEQTKLKGWRSFTLEPGQDVKIGALETGGYGFIAFSGGLDVPTVLNSRSSYARAQIGQHPLKSGDQLPLLDCDRELVSDLLLPQPPVQPDFLTLRVVLGPQEDYFTPNAIESFCAEIYTVSNAADRMGARLDGPALAHDEEKGAQIISDGVVPGAIQVPGNGSPIILLRDGQTVGGYPKIATVISCDLPLIANARAGTKIRFERVDVRDATLLVRDYWKSVQKLKSSAIKASADGFVDLNALYESNLIGGVVDMAAPDVTDD